MPGRALFGSAGTASLGGLTGPHPTGPQVDGAPGRGQRARLWFEDPRVQRPAVAEGGRFKARGAPARRDKRVYPRECREAGTTYKGAFTLKVRWQVGDGEVEGFERNMGHIPIMVGSRLCNLRGLAGEELVRRKEERHELGGYFVCNGNERLIRMIINQRRHFVVALARDSYKKRGPVYTEFGAFIRCVRPDQTSVTVNCHYLKTGNVQFKFGVGKQEYFVPVGILLKCFVDVTERETFEALVGVAEEKHFSFFADRAEIILREATRRDVRSRADALRFLGGHFRAVLDVPDDRLDAEVGQELIDRVVFVHLETNEERYHLLVFMVQKLLALVAGQICPDDVDSSAYHEILLPGHLLAVFFREALETCLETVVNAIKADVRRQPEAVDLESKDYMHTKLEKIDRKVGEKMEYFLNTGNLNTRGRVDLSQASGFTVVAERLNIHRYYAHFKSVHRGAYFAQMRTTRIRKLLPESWGFLCPVHTPDGAPCGLLLHLTHACRVVVDVHRSPEERQEARRALCRLLAAMGVVMASTALGTPRLPEHLPVLLDGRLVGHVRAAAAPAVARTLRAFKAAALAGQPAGGVPAGPLADRLGADLWALVSLVPEHLEVVAVPFRRGANQSGLYLFTEAARMARAVHQVDAAGACTGTELVGTFEQVYLDILCPDGTEGGTKEDFHPTHREISPGNIFSMLAALTPWCEHNQSPRNMYQCQMAKQTMGTPCHAFPHKTDNKMYRLHYPQAPLTRTRQYGEYGMNDFPSGTNAVVAVISYTGYDMEDAMIINRASMQRGFAHGTMYKTETVDLSDKQDAEFGPPRLRPGAEVKVRPLAKIGEFGERCPRAIPPGGVDECYDPWEEDTGPTRPAGPGEYPDMARIDVDGLPHVGAPVWPAEAYYGVRDAVTDRGRTKQLDDVNAEIAVVDQVTAVGTKTQGLQKANIKLRFRRDPTIGDKFSTRHGQKGILSKLWPDKDMPYVAATGMRPDVIFNPHGFPSRMTVGMWIEAIASKSAALRGDFKDCTAFAPGEGDHEDKVRAFGEELEAQGFSRWGNETMISGITGEEFEVDIFVGLMYYQRLRHMVSDKFQVRSTGPVNTITKQPIKGRKVGGGIRFGEMERDALLAYGCSYTLHDRLHRCSDYHIQDVCAGCGNLLSTHMEPPVLSSVVGKQSRPQVTCRVCGHGKWVKKVAMPYVFKYLASELAGMNVKVALDLEPEDERF